MVFEIRKDKKQLLGVNTFIKSHIMENIIS